MGFDIFLLFSDHAPASSIISDIFNPVFQPIQQSIRYARSLFRIMYPSAQSTPISSVARVPPLQHSTHLLLELDEALLEALEGAGCPQSCEDERMGRASSKAKGETY